MCREDRKLEELNEADVIALLNIVCEFGCKFSFEVGAK